MSTSQPAPSRYLPLVKVGSGAFATVHVALDRGPLGVRQLVALKILHPHLADEAPQREALVREARLLSSVRHPNVVELRDVDLEDGVRLVLGYVEGVTLGKWLVELGQSGGRIPTAAAVRIARDAATGLHAIHEATSETGRALGLVHRDVSPQNLLVGIDGVTRLSDFGTAKVLFEPTSETTEGSLKGKLGYMAPEYIRGAPVDRRIDVFALGVVVWEALTGKRLFRGSNEGETLDRILSGEVPAPSSVDTSLAPFDDALAHALARDPRERTATALDFGRAIEGAARGAGIDADHAMVGEAMRAAFDALLVERRTAVGRAIAELDAGPKGNATTNAIAMASATMHSNDASVASVTPASADASAANVSSAANASSNASSEANASSDVNASSELAAASNALRSLDSAVAATATPESFAKPRSWLAPVIVGLGVATAGGWALSRSAAPVAVQARVSATAPPPALPSAPPSASEGLSEAAPSAVPIASSSSSTRASVDEVPSSAPAKTGKALGRRGRPPPNPY